MQLISRSEARSLGLKRFYTAAACPAGHLAERLTSNGTCIACSKDRLAIWEKRKREERNGGRPSSREVKRNAILKGENRYFTGVPCANGHMAERRSSDGKCISCVRIKNANRAKNNPEYMKKYIGLWQKKNRDKLASYWRNRRARISKATGEHDHTDVLRIFKLQKGKCACCNSQLIQSGTGKYHVDHIFPIAKGGRNDPDNLQILCPRCNLSKGSKDPVVWAKERGMLL